MIVQEKKKAIKKPVLRFKMYKSGKQMINASFIGLSMVGVMTVTSTINANADANTPAAVSQTSQANTTATPSSGSNMVTNQVTVNSSTLDSAVSAAKAAGLPVNTKPATSQTVQESQVPAARQQIESDYQSQASNINSTVGQFSHAKSNANSYNGSKGDTSALDAAASSAAAVPGLSVVKDNDKPTSPVNAGDDDAIASASAGIQSDYANQINDINKAIATQKQNNREWAEYERKLQDYKNGHGISGQVVTSGDVVQRLEIDNDPGMQVVATNLNNIKASYIDDEKFNGIDSVGKCVHLETIDQSKPGSASLTFTNASNLSYMGKKITKVVEQISLIPNSDARPSFDAAANMYWGYNTWNNKTITSWRFYYVDGSEVFFTPNTAYLSVASLNNYSNNLSAYSIESTTIDNGGTALSLLGSSVTAHGNSLYSNNANSYNTQGIQICGVKSGEQGAVDTGFKLNSSVATNSDIPQGWDRTGSPERYYGSGLISLNGNDISMIIEALNTNMPSNGHWRNGMWWNVATLIPKTPGPQTPKVPKTSNAHFHYDTKSVKILMPEVLIYGHFRHYLHVL